MGEIKQEWYSISELVAMGYGSKNTIRQHIMLGGFGAGNPGGGKWLIKKDEYDEWLKTRGRNNWMKGGNRWQIYKRNR